MRTSGTYHYKGDAVRCGAVMHAFLYVREKSAPFACESLFSFMFYDTLKGECDVFASYHEKPARDRDRMRGMRVTGRIFMLYHFLYAILYPLKEVYPFLRHLNIFRYITFRAALAALTALIISFFFGKMFIAFLRKINFGQVVRHEGPATHYVKRGTPTMGGILIVLSVTVATLLWGKLFYVNTGEERILLNTKLIILVLSMLALAGIGFLDDFLKVKEKNSRGIHGTYKLIVQGLVGLAVGIFLYSFDTSTFLLKLAPGSTGQVIKHVEAGGYSTYLFLPFFSDFNFDLKIFYIPFAMLVVMGTSNAVNLTDGLDGLAIGVMIFMAVGYTVFAYVSGHEVFAAYLKVPHVVDAAELTIFTAALLGAGMGFLWFNAHPAEMFMGDVGSLSLGGVLGVIAIFLKQELLLLIVGGVYVIELLSVVVQVISYKLTKRRVFLMSPLHHHFELAGWPESKVVIRFWIIGAILALVGIATLKLR